METTSAILTNNYNIIDVLDTCECESNGIEADVIIEATGLLKLLQSRKFFFVAVTMVQVPMLLSRADKALQSRTCDVTNAFWLVETTIDLPKGMHRDIDGTFEQISAPVEDALEENEQSTESPNKRQRNFPSTLNNSVVYSTVGHADASSTATTNQQSLRLLLIEILDNTIVDMKERFSERNISLLSAL